MLWAGTIDHQAIQVLPLIVRVTRSRRRFKCDLAKEVLDHGSSAFVLRSRGRMHHSNPDIVGCGSREFDDSRFAKLCELFAVAFRNIAAIISLQVGIQPLGLFFHQLVEFII